MACFFDEYTVERLDELRGNTDAIPKGRPQRDERTVSTF